MFNSVARYLWGSADGDETLSASNQPESGEAIVHQSVKIVGVTDDGKELVLPEVVECDQDEDWVIVGDADKENCNSPGVASHHPNYLHHHHLHHFNHHLTHHHSNDSLSQPMTEVEMLDEASSLNHAAYDYKSFSDQEDNGIDSGRRPSSPESVFSVCSGRSSATYKPRGLDSEVWIVAPPPCFTGSQCGSLSPLVSSPLENLLIEHPSMSVYVSQPFHNHSPPPSSQDHVSDLQGLSSIPVSGSTADDARLSSTVEEEGDDTADESQSRVTDPSLVLTPRQSQSRETVVHQHELSLEAMLKSQDASQRKVISIAQRAISKQKCRRQNQVQFVSSSSKAGISKKNKQLRPSGFRSSRMTQRNSVSNKHF